MAHQIYLLCNAHLDPVWQWEWEEGAAAAVSTFRAAADFCEEFDAFIFNHNEALLYRWVEEYEPVLFERIRALVRQGRWHILGGWYLQPDCNMPSGESIVRQILAGRRYFQRHFGVTPRTAANLDSFGHSRGLVQILAKSGYDSYLYMRPETHPDAAIGRGDGDFRWIGLDGSEIVAHKLGMGYNSRLGEAVGKIQVWIKAHPTRESALLPWGVGNHGGGASRKDIREIDQLIREEGDSPGGCIIRHATPEMYFANLHKNGNSEALPEHRRDLNPRFVGCYTSQVRIKQRHRKLENELYMTEKMASEAALRGRMDYPVRALQEAQADLLLSEFHDILPGSSVQPVEEAALRTMDHGLEILSRLKARAFFALSGDQAPAAEGEIPILVYNPHPYPVEGIFGCEFMLADQNWQDTFSLPEVYRDGERIPSQAEKEESNLSLDWRKRVVFYAQLEPCAMNRFDCRIRMLPENPFRSYALGDEPQVFGNDRLRVTINGRTGLLDSLVADGVEYVRPGAFQALVMADSTDSWKMRATAFREVEGAFQLMTPEEGTAFSGITGGTVASVRIIESGEVRTVVEAVFGYGRSALCLRYGIPARGTELTLEARVLWGEKDRMLKLEVPTAFSQAQCRGQVMFGAQELPCDGTESVSQKWLALVDEQRRKAFTVINDGTYASDFDQEEGHLRLTLLRSAGYCAHPILDRPLLPQDRFSPRMEQGERLFRFWFRGGDARARLDAVDREALARNEQPFALSFFPAGTGAGSIAEGGRGMIPPVPLVLKDDVIQMTALKRAEDELGNAPEDSSPICGENFTYIIRLQEPTGIPRSTVLSAGGTDFPLEFRGFEVKTLAWRPVRRSLEETDMMEK